jgi:hypothetical protein
MGFYKVTYWLKSGPFLVENQFWWRIVRGHSGDQSPTFPGNTEEKNFFDLSLKLQIYGFL